MARTRDEGRDRKEAIVAAAGDVFLRYGFKKTSMDDLARAADLSRQGLDLHFPSKEQLFVAVVHHFVATTQAGYAAALARSDTDTATRLIGALEAFHGHAAGLSIEAQMNELLEVAARLVGDVVPQLEQSIVADLAKVLEKSGVARAWKPARIGAAELAANLYATSVGLKHRVKSFAEFHDRLTLAVRITLAGAVPVPRAK